jgi:hypothetical protein
MRLTILSLVGLMLFASSCSTVKPGKTKASTKKSAYSEDLTAYRPEPIVADELLTDSVSSQIITDTEYTDVTSKLNTVLDTAAIYARSTQNYIDGFTIQVYGGVDRALAKDFRLNLIRNFPATEPRTVFEQPNYKVRVGQYYTRLEAQHLFTQVKQVFPKAIIIPARIYVK